MFQENKLVEKNSEDKLTLSLDLIQMMIMF